ncbi:MAG TPA: tetratricopeptide repeat protein [Thermoanaerobaculia bacterium]|nr:tetratricopeptide repeat protein [Thermoanaerobaculia bacterium]
MVDEAGQPVEGADIVVTSVELGRFRETAKTNKRGKATVSFVDATRAYVLHVEAEGLAPLEQQLQPRPLETVREKITLRRGRVTEAGDERPAERGAPAASFTPAQRTFNEGVEALRGGQVDQAAEKFREALEKDAKLAEAWSALAVVHVEREEWQAAIDAAERYVELKEADAGIHRVLYRAHQALGNSAEAERAREQLATLGRGQDSAAFAYNEGVDAARIGDDAAALERFEESLELNPELAPALLAMAILHVRQSRFAEAASAAERLLELEPENTTGLEIRWDAYRNLGDATREETARAELARRDPTRVVAYLLDRGKQLFDAGDARGAAEALGRAVELAPGDAQIHYRLGLAHVSLDQQAVARRHLERFLELAPDHPEAASAREMLSYLD